MKIAIVEDEAVCLEQVAAVAREYAAERTEQKMTVDTFSHPEDLLEAAMRIGGYDIYILDVIMPNMDGIRLGKQLRDAGDEGKIIYLTASPEYAVDSFRVKAFDYLLKPIDKAAFCQTVDEAVEAISQKKNKSLLVKTKTKSVKLPFDAIMYAEFHSRAITYYLTKGRREVSMTLRTSFTDAIAELVADKRFAACGQSMVVNLDHVTEVENDAVIFDGTYRALLGEKNCRKLRLVWSAYLFDGEG